GRRDRAHKMWARQGTEVRGGSCQQSGHFILRVIHRDPQGRGSQLIPPRGPQVVLPQITPCTTAAHTTSSGATRVDTLHLVFFASFFLDGVTPKEHGVQASRRAGYAAQSLPHPGQNSSEFPPHRGVRAGFAVPSSGSRQGDETWTPDSRASRPSRRERTRRTPPPRKHR